MILTVTLNPAIDRLILLNKFQLHRLHRLKGHDKTMTLPGGKGVNIAMTLNLLGNEVVATGFAAGHTGHMLADALRNKGITTNFIFTDGNTRTNISLLDMENETLTEINESGPEVSLEDQEYFYRNYKRLLHYSKLVVIGGSMPANVPAEYYAKLIFEANRKSVPIIVHTSSRYLDAVLTEKPTALMPDLRSKLHLHGKPLNVLQALHDLGLNFFERCPALQFVVFPNRIENVLVMDKTVAKVLRPDNLNIINMLGYGDAFVAGFTHGMLHGMSFDEMSVFAAACGLSNVEQVCKDLKTVDQINTNLSRIKIEPYA